jgi:hypothetical protein
MKIDVRTFKAKGGNINKVLFIAESEEESKIFDLLGDDFKGRDSIPVLGEIRLSDGTGEHYILLHST